MVYLCVLYVRVFQKKLLKTLLESIKENNVDSFHCLLDELERIAQNNERMKELLERDGTLCFAAHIGSNLMVETLIQKGVGKEYAYPIVGV